MNLPLILAMVLSPALAAAPPNELLITGSSTMAPLVAELGTAFEKSNKQVRVEVQTGGSSKGISDCRDGLNQFGMVSRELTPDEKDLAGTAIARDGLAFIVHSTNKVRNLSRETIKKIYTGQITNWKEVGGADSPITVISKAEGRATLDFFLHEFSLKNSDIKAKAVIGDEEQGLKTVVSTPNSIAYLSISTAEAAEKHGQKVAVLAVDGTKASMAAVRNGTYKMSRPLNLVVKGEMSPAAKSFLNFVTTKEGQALVAKLGYIPAK